MNKRSLTLLIVVIAALAVAVVLWKRNRDDRSAARPTPAHAKTPPRTPVAKRIPGKTPTKAPPTMPRVSMDDDPVGTLRLEGQVLDEEEAPVSGAVVNISSNPRRTATSEKDGSFHFDKLVGRTYSLWVRKDALVGGPVRHKLTAKSDPVAIRLRMGATVEVTVVDAKKQTPIAGASVTLRSIGDQTETTDSDGKVSFIGVASGFFAVVASKDGFAPERRAVQAPPSTTMAVKVRLALRRGSAVSGVVMDEKGAPVRDARVIVHDTSGLYSLVSASRDGVTTDTKGRFRIPAVAAGTYRVVASKDGYLTSPAANPITTRGSSAIKDLRIVLRAGGTLSGVVQDSAEQLVPWATVRVTAADQSVTMGGANVRQVTTDERGTFTLRGLPRAALSVIASSDTASSKVVSADLKTTVKVEALVLTLDVEGEIAGVVQSSTGEPIAEAQVSALPDFFSGTSLKHFVLRGMKAQTSDGGGRFRFRGLPPGTYRLRASRTAMTGAAFRQPGTQAATGDTDVKLVLRASGAIKGAVQYKDGTSPTLFSVSVGFPPGTPVADDRGRFEIPDLPAGTHDVTIRGGDFADAIVRDVKITPGETTDLGTITAHKGRDATGRVVDSTGAPVAGASVVVATRLIGDGKSMTANLGGGADEALGVRRATTDESGTFRVRGIGDRELVIVAEHAAKGRCLPQLIPAGLARPDFTLALRGFGRVTGTVRAGNSPAPRIPVIATPVGSASQSIAVTTGSDGTYVIEKLPAGEHALTAMLGTGGGTGATSGGATVTVKAGAEAKADIDIEVGSLEVTVTVSPKPGAKVDAAQVFLVKGVVKSRNGKELQAAFLGAGKTGGARMAFATGKPLQAKYDKVTAGRYSVCVVPITGDITDPTCGARIQKAALELGVHCSMHDVASSKSRAMLSVQVPSMSPNVCDEKPAKP